MWARSAETALAVWLAISPFVFGHYGEIDRLTISDLASAGVIAVLACASFAHRLRRAHLGILAVSGWLVAHGYFAFEYPTPPGAQNEMLVGLILVLFAIVPTRAEVPPDSWRAFLERQVVSRGDGSSLREPASSEPADESG